MHVLQKQISLLFMKCLCVNFGLIKLTPQMYWSRFLSSQLATPQHQKLLIKLNSNCRVYILFIELLLHHGKYIKLVKPKLLLPPANGIWGKVMFSQVFVCPQGVRWKGVWWRGCGRHPPQTQRQTSPGLRDRQPLPIETANEAGGTHSSGMHSC